MERFTMDDYLILSTDDRTRFDDWLRECGIRPEIVREVRLDGDDIVVDQWVLDKNRKPIYNYKLKDVETEEVRKKKVGKPPCWTHQQLL